jgi:uncharacterized membrane protein YkoI
MKKFIIPFVQVLVVFAMIATAQARTLEKIQHYVPGGEVVQEKEREVKVRTKSGSIVEVEFEVSGEFEEASGKSPENDVLVPGTSLIPLSKAYASLKEAGKSASGDWSLEKSFIKGWVYEFEGFENGKEVDYLIDAKTAKFLETRVDD